MKSYYEKYLKYKTKYLKLKNKSEDSRINIAYANITHESYTGEGFYFEENIENKNEYYLYTTGLIGCVGLFITFNFNDKKLVWLTHVADGTTTEQFIELYNRICIEISKLISFEVTPENIGTFEDFKLYLVNFRGPVLNCKNELNLEDQVNNENMRAYTKNKGENYGADKKKLFEIIEEYFTNIQKLDFVKLYGNTIIYKFKVIDLFGGRQKMESKVYAGPHDIGFIEPLLTNIAKMQS